MLDPKSYCTIHTYAEAALVTALEWGDTSPRGLLRGFREHAPGLAASQFRLGRRVRLFDHLPPPCLADVPDMFVLHSGIGPAGLYVVHALMPQDGNGYVLASFVPARASTPWEIDALFQREVAESPTGRRSLADLERSRRPGPETPSMKDVVSGIMDVHGQNIIGAHFCIGDHADRLCAVSNRAAPYGARGMAASTRVGVEGRPLLKLGKAMAEPWVAPFPGRGHLIVAGTPGFTARFVTLNGLFDDSWPDWVSSDTLFRPLTAEADPGLLDRWQHAADNRLDADVGAAFKEAGKAAATPTSGSPQSH